MVNYLASAGFLVVGISSWITINGLYGELNLMVDDIPEGWAIGTYIALIIQLANVSVLLYSLIPNHYKTSKFVINTTYIILSISFISMLIMAYSWKSDITIFGKQHSIYLLITTFGTSVADCMTSMVFWVFVSWFPTQYIAILAAGEVSSGIISSILIWIQQLGTKNPRYSVEIYLVSLSLLLPISGIAFHLLLRYKHKIDKCNDTDIDEVLLNKQEQIIVNESMNDTEPSSDEQNEHIEVAVTDKKISYFKYLLILGILSGVDNGMIPSVGTYAVFPYGNTVFIASNTISNCISPITASLPSYFPKFFVNDLMINITTFGWIITSLYILIIALFSPHPWGSSSDSSCFASVIMVICNVVYSMMLSCCKSCSITLIRQKLLEEKTADKLAKNKLNKMMENIGKFIQFGSFTFAVMFFVLVQYAGIFHQ